jgi:hypothetical protein
LREAQDSLVDCGGARRGNHLRIVRIRTAYKYSHAPLY